MIRRFLALALFPIAASAQDTAQLFQINCVACHQPDYQLVGPSLVEIAGIYKDDPDGFVKWCLTPGRKREQLIEMPSMAHVGEANLRAIHGHILKLAEGKTEKKPATAKGDQFPLPSKRPLIQRIFLPDISPAAIAVALPGDISFAFDAAECRLRYVWTGGFIDGWDYWKGNGSSLAKLKGKVVYRETDPVIAPASSPPEFLGYSIDKQGYPTFRYRIGGVTYGEKITAHPDGNGIVREITTDSSQPVATRLPADGYVKKSGTPEAFTLTVTW